MSQSEFIIAASTIVLVFITGYYAVVTHRILKYQKDITTLELRPFLKMETLLCNLVCKRETQEVEAVQLGIKFKNTSRVMLKYCITIISASIEDAIIDNPQFINYGGYVYPDQTVDFTYPLIQVAHHRKPHLDAKIEYEVEYYSNENQKYNSVREYIIAINVGDDDNKTFIWKSLKEEEREL